ncbi:conserved Plasmodium protein, unknown function [Plasmodium gallinaceum]|uniref:Protein CINCH n=1 Tax=Plasmodium gallinaceum TaxID=5849 RepID=A0A1J1H115_PLAGA|nr:conserved Plasmodium protein, unknown function [Plasmodium gallinaceum]CRG98149.1 conserved Plasmodium protein, unknown function [Plasmodium gallinaceum]
MSFIPSKIESFEIFSPNINYRNSNFSIKPMETLNSSRNIENIKKFNYINKFDIDNMENIKNPDEIKRENFNNISGSQKYGLVNLENNLYINQTNILDNGIHKIKEKKISPTNKNSMDALENFFSASKFKIEKIKENNSIDNNYLNKNKKNLTSILPFDKIVEECALQNLLTKNQVHDLYNHQNIYDERINIKEPYNASINNYNENNILSKDFIENISDNPFSSLSKDQSFFNKKEDYINSLESGNFNSGNIFYNKYSSVKSLNNKMSQKINDSNNNGNGDGNNNNKNNNNSNSNNNNNSNNSNNNNNNSSSSNNNNNNNNSTTTTTNNNNNSNNDEDENEDEYNNNNLFEVYDYKKNKKVIYYAVKNHYNPYKEMSKKEKRNYEVYDNKLYENDIYDYLLNQYEKNYKNLIDQRFPPKGNFINERQEIFINQINLQKNSLDDCRNEEINENKKGEKETNTNENVERKIENINEDISNNQENKNCSCNKINEQKKIEKKESEIPKINSYGCKLNQKDTIDSLKKKEKKKYKTDTRFLNLYNDDILDIYKYTTDIYTHKPKLFIYSLKDNNGSNKNCDNTLKINKEFKKILKKLKYKNTVVISNIGRKCGSSTFSNYIINNIQINNFTNEINNEEECIYSYVTSNQNKINYIYLDYDKLAAKRNEDDNNNKINKFVTFSFYFSNIIIFHINNKNYLDIFYILSDYYDIIKNIRENIKCRRKKYYEQKKKKDIMKNKSDKFLKLNTKNINKNSSTDISIMDSSYSESDDSIRESFDENNFYFPYFIFVLRDMNRNDYIKIKSKSDINDTNNFMDTRKYFDSLIYKINDTILQKKIKYILKFLTKKILFFLPSLYKNNDESVINYDYIFELKDIKRELYIQGKCIDNMYINNGAYIYKYLSMLIYTINNDIFYSSNYLKSKIENFESKMLHDILTENFLLHIRKKIEKKLPMKPNLFLTLTNELKIEFILTYEKFSVGNTSTKRKYKNQLCNNIDVIILKAYKENIAFSCYSFFNIINKKINDLQIYNKINDREYIDFEELLKDVYNINDRKIDNFIYNEILNIKKEEIFTHFIKNYYDNSENISPRNCDRYDLKKRSTNYCNSDSTNDPDELNKKYENEKSKKYSSINLIAHNFAPSSFKSFKNKGEEKSVKYDNIINNKNEDVLECLQNLHEDNKKDMKKKKKFGSFNDQGEFFIDAADSYFYQSKTKNSKYVEEKDPPKSKTSLRRSFHKFKSDMGLLDARKKKIRNENYISKKYHSSDYFKKKGVEAINKNLLFYENSGSSDDIFEKQNDHHIKQYPRNSMKQNPSNNIQVIKEKTLNLEKNESNNKNLYSKRTTQKKKRNSCLPKHKSKSKFNI